MSKGIVDEIDLNRPAVIEASAGTGKTYTIENLVTRLLEEKRLRLEQILLVTFTEKATGEMKERIRVKIQNRLDEIRESGNADLKLHLQEQLDHFDEASIHTIHGFCQRALKMGDWMWQYGDSIEDESELALSSLREIQRDVWPEKFGKDLAQWLAVCRYPALNQFGISSWERTVLSLAGIWKPEQGDELCPDGRELFGAPQWTQFMKALIAHCFDEAPGSQQSGDAYPLLEEYRQCPIKETMKKSVLPKVLEPFLQLINSDIEGWDWLHRGREFLELCRGYSRFKTDAGQCLVPEATNIKKNHELSDELQDALQVIADAIDSLNDQINMSQATFSAMVVRDLREHVQESKRSENLWGFDDLIISTYRALCEEAAESEGALSQRLRKKYSVAIVDEFQDTDLLQWAIFKRVFLDSNSDHGLMLVADPKQAIYRFRGADIHAYFKALEDMQAAGARTYRLDTNWRSRPELIEALNKIYASGSLFDGEDQGQVKAPQRSNLRSKCYRDESGRGCLNLIRFGASPSGKCWKSDERGSAMARFVANEISHLLNEGNSLLDIDMGSGARPLNAGDIAVLFQKKSEMDMFEHELSLRGIPFGYYKKPGVFSSDEARHLEWLLEALVDPNDSSAFSKCALSMFFELRPEILYSGETEKIEAIRKLLQTWSELAAERRWAELFNAVMMRSGILARKHEENGSPRLISSRAMTNLGQIFQYVGEAADREAWDLETLLHKYRQYLWDKVALPEDDQLFRIDSEVPSVKLMTMHVSKGLEFPVVFFAGGFRESPSLDHLRYHDDRQVQVFDFKKSKDALERHQNESEGDLKRLTYVAMTRAIYKLYMPYIKDSPNLWGDIVYPALNPLVPDDFSDLDALEIPHTSLLDIHEGQPLNRVEFIVDEQEASAETPEKESKPAFERVFHIKRGGVLAARRQIHSFSGMLWRDKKAHASLAYLDEAKEDDEPEKSIQFMAEDLHGLPPGKQTGNVCHEILEHIDMAVVRACQNEEELLATERSTSVVINDAYQHHFPSALNDELREERLRSLAKYVFHALKTPLLAEGDIPICSKDVELLREVEFYFRLDEADRGTHVIKGFIDLIAVCEGKYYLLDWKSNYLSDYSAEAIELNMQQEGYDLQFQIYALALRSWLTPHLKEGQSFENLFGGVYYLYLRGLAGGNPGEGIFHHPGRDLERYEERIRECLA